MGCKVSGDNADEVQVSLKKLGGLYEDRVASLKAFGSENKEKRIAIEERDGKIRDLNEQVDKLGKQIENINANDPSEELDGLRQFKADTLKHQRTSFTGEFEQVMSHPNFEKASKLFKMPEMKDEKPSWETLSDDDINNNMSELKKLKELDYFTSQNESPKKVFNGATQPPKTQAELIGSAQSIAELEKIIMGTT